MDNVKVIRPPEEIADHKQFPANTGISEDDRRHSADSIAVILADTYVLYLKTQNFHWNVGGINFETLHLMFEKQYKELAEEIDVIAERIRALGYPVHATFSTFAKLSTIKDEDTVPSAREMIRILCDGHEMIVRKAREVIPAFEKLHDGASADLINHQLQYHEKTAWMLRSLIA
jgi:starvation-inducible DNA-binding protein